MEQLCGKQSVGRSASLIFAHHSTSCRLVNYYIQSLDDLGIKHSILCCWCSLEITHVFLRVLRNMCCDSAKQRAYIFILRTLRTCLFGTFLCFSLVPQSRTNLHSYKTCQVAKERSHKGPPEQNKEETEVGIMYQLFLLRESRPIDLKL